MFRANNKWKRMGKQSSEVKFQVVCEWSSIINSFGEGTAENLLHKPPLMWSYRICLEICTILNIASFLWSIFMLFCEGGRGGGMIFLLIWLWQIDSHRRNLWTVAKLRKVSAIPSWLARDHFQVSLLFVWLRGNVTCAYSHRREITPSSFPAPPYVL